MCLTTTRSPASMKSLIGSRASASQASRSCSHQPHEGLPTYERPRLRPSLRGPRDDVGGVAAHEGHHVSRVPRLVAARTTSTFSCDIAYSDSPTASRASASAKYASIDDPPIAARDDLRSRSIGSRSAAQPSLAGRQHDGRLRASRTSLDLDASVFQGSVIARSGGTPSRPETRLSRSRASARTRRPGRQSRKRLQVTGVARLDRSSDDLHVLLRHRPRSIPQAQESA